ncbi:MAG TPA: hypothetical protein VGB91_15915 [Rhizomicrobium sp.]
MKRWATAVAVWIVSAGLVHAQPVPKEFLGTWVLRLGDRTLYVLALRPDGGGIGGYVESPAHLTVFNGRLFLIAAPGVRRDRIVRSHLAGGALVLAAQDAGDPKHDDDFVLRLDGAGARLAFGDDPAQLGADALFLTRAGKTAAVATDWQIGRAYTVDDGDTPSAEMKAIYDADQGDRGSDKADWAVVAKSDAARRLRTRRLLAQGALRTGKDYEEASFVFQHGDAPDDYLLAHTLAVIAVSKGDGAAVWIAAATLDRYLQRIGRKQIYGTQFVKPRPDAPWTQEPYDRTLISDALRRQLGVPAHAVLPARLKGQ